MLHLVDGLILTGDKKMSHENCHKIVNKKVDQKIAQHLKKSQNIIFEGVVVLTVTLRAGDFSPRSSKIDF